MTAPEIKTKFAKTVASVLLVSQIMLGVSFLATPAPKAQAIWGVADFSFDTIIADLYDIAKDIGVAAAKRIALKYSNKFLTRFVNKVQDKYKIKNFLYYDQVLTSHLLTSFIYDKIEDPDLRRIYTLMERMAITGEATGYSGGSPPDQAVLPLLKQAIADLYVEQTGIDPRAVARPNDSMSNQEYFKYAQGYYFNSPGYTEAHLRGNYGAFQSASTTAAQLEILVGNSLKAGRVLGGTCSGADIGPPSPGTAEARSSPTACEAAGGTWVPSALDEARAFISNPTQYLDKTIDKALGVIFEGTYDPNNIWSAIGSSLGNYIFGQLELDDEGTNGSGSLDEYGSPYVTDTGDVPPDRDLDTVDLDGIPDGEDADGDGDIDVCYHGGTPPDECAASSTATSSPYFIPLCKSGYKAADALREYIYFITTNRNHLQGDGENFRNTADADIWARRTEQVSRAIDEVLQTIESFHNRNWDRFEIAIGRYSSYISSVAQSLIADRDLDLARFGNGGGSVNNLIINSNNILDYIARVALAIGDCEDPDDTVVPTIISPEIIDAGGTGGGGGGGGGTGLCGVSYTQVDGAATMYGAVETAMGNVLNDPYWDTAPNIDSEAEDFRDAVIAELAGMGENAVPGYNGNCNSNPSNLAVQTSATRGELFSILRDGADCNNDVPGTIAAAAACRPGGDGVYSGPWNTLSTGTPP